MAAREEILEDLEDLEILEVDPQKGPADQEVAETLERLRTKSLPSFSLFGQL